MKRVVFTELLVTRVKNSIMPVAGSLHVTTSSAFCLELGEQICLHDNPHDVDNIFL